MNKDVDEMILGAAAQRGDLKVVQQLILRKDKSILNAQDIKGYAPIHHAAYFDESQILKLLLDDSLVDPTTKTKKGLTCLHLAAIQNSLQAIDVILKIKRSANLLDITNDWKESPLHVAAAAGHANVVKRLLTHGADATGRDKWNRTPLMVAREHGENTTISILETNSSSNEKKDDQLLEKSEVVEHSIKQKQKHTALIGDFMQVVQTRNAPNVDNVKVKHVINFDKKTDKSSGHEQKKT